MNHFFIDTSHSGIWFSLIYLFTIIMVNSVFIIKAVKGRHSFISVWLIAVTGMLFFMAGIYLFPLSLPELKLFILGGALSATGEKSLMGGILGLVGLLVAIYWLKERVSIIDNLAVVLLIGMGLQNIGCLKAGCCFGSEVTIPWAVQYDKFSSAFSNQLNQGIVQFTDTAALPVHPVQIYLLLGCMLIAFIVWKTKNRWHAPLSLLMIGLLLYMVLRFAMEFLRDPATNHGLGYTVFGLKAIQWYQIALLVIFGTILFVRESKFRFRVISSIKHEPGLVREITLLVFIVLFSWLFSGLFGFTEKLLLNSSLITAVFLVGWKVFKTLTLPQYRIATLLVLIGSSILLGQSNIPQNKDEKVTYTEIGSGFQFSQYYNVVSTNLGLEEGYLCTPYTYYATGSPKLVKYNSYMGGFSVAKTEIRSKYNRFSYGVDAYFGADKGEDINNLYNTSLTNIAVHPFISVSGRWTGISTGIHLGTFHYADWTTSASSDNVGEIVGEPRTLYIFPSLNWRIGPYDKFYLETFMASQFPSASPIMLGGFGFGSGLGKVDGTNIGIGYATSGLYFKSMFPVKENLYLDGFLSFRSNTYSSEEVDNSSRFGLSVGVHHRFNYKTVPVPPKK